MLLKYFAPMQGYAETDCVLDIFCYIFAIASTPSTADKSINPATHVQPCLTHVCALNRG